MCSKTIYFLLLSLLTICQVLIIANSSPYDSLNTLSQNTSNTSSPYESFNKLPSLEDQDQYEYGPYPNYSAYPYYYSYPYNYYQYNRRQNRSYYLDQNIHPQQRKGVQQFRPDGECRRG